MSNRPQQMKHGTYRHYRRMPDGTEIYLGEVDYTYPAEDADTGRDAERVFELALRDACETERHDRVREDFETLADSVGDAD